MTAHPEAVCQHGRKMAIWGACFKVGSSLTFTNGILFLYLMALNLEGSLVLFLLSMVNVLFALLLIPSAHFCDRYGKRRFSLIGISLCGASFFAIPLAAWLGEFPTLMVVVLGGAILLYGLGHALQMGGWFSLLSPIVPPPMRGRFFGMMRMLWQSASILFALGVTLALPKEAPVWLLQMILFMAGLTILPWGWFYSRIPELDPPGTQTAPIGRVLLDAVRRPGHAGFCAYSFIILLFTGGCPALFSLVEKRSLLLSDGWIIFLTNLTMFGSVVGYWLGGRAVDRFGTKWVFLTCHGGYGLVIFLFLLRDLSGLPPTLMLPIVHFLYGLPVAACSVAMSKEMMALAPPRNPSVSMAVVQALGYGGTALSGVLAGTGLHLGMFSPSWTLYGSPRDACDAILLVMAVMIVAMTVTLGLVPSVLGRDEATPPER